MQRGYDAADSVMSVWDALGRCVCGCLLLAAPAFLSSDTPACSPPYPSGHCLPCSKEALFPGKSEIDCLQMILKTLGSPTEESWPGEQ